MTRFYLFLACLLAALVGGFFLGCRYAQPQAVTETAQAARREPDGALLLQRAPAALPAPPAPEGLRVERVLRVTVQPKAVAAVTAGKNPEATAVAPCAPVTVDMSLLRDRDGSQRVLASTPDGRVLGGIDAPLLPDVVAPAHPWALGLSAGMGSGTGGSHTPGIFAERALGPLMLGADVYRAPQGVAARLHLAFRF